MKTFTFVICFLLSAIASFAASPDGGDAGVPANINAINGRPIATVAPFTVCLEAETSNGDGPVSTDPNASNGLTRGLQNSSDYFIQYQTDVPSTGKYLIKLRYYAPENAQVTVSVNNATPTQVELPASHSWNIAWVDHTIEVSLVAGNNSIRIKELPGFDVRHDKSCWTEIPGTAEPITCDFRVAPRAVGMWPIYQPGQSVTLDSRCTGGDCDGASLAWIGNGINEVGKTVTINAPTAPGDYTYTLFAFKKGCPKDTSVDVTIRVQTTPAQCDYVVGIIRPYDTPPCGQTFGVYPDCFGTGCGYLKYTWTGPGIDTSGVSAKIHLPTTNGTYTYTMTTSSPGCPDKTAAFQYAVYNCGAGTSEPYSSCIESEHAFGDAPISEDPNASNGKTRGAQDRSDYLTWYYVTGVKIDGPHELTLRYYAEANTAVNIWVAGVTPVHKVELPATNSWNIVWAERTIVLDLKKGNNTISIQGIPGYSPVRQDKICIKEVPGTGNPFTCDFDITAQATTVTPACGAPFSLTANCSGPDCGVVGYQWKGINGFDQSTQTINVTAPSANGSYTYTVSSSKDGCAPKTVTVPFTVSTCPPGEGVIIACVEAEHSASNGAGTDDPNASNGQTRGSQNNYDYFVDYQVNGVGAGFYPVTLRYYAEANAQVSVSVNGDIALPVVQLPATNSWNIVAREETFYITLFEGNNTIRIQGLPGAACRQDKICVGNDPNNARMAGPEFIQTQADAPLLQAYPNPASGEFKAVFNLKTGEFGTIKVIDVQGKVWHTRDVSGKGMHEERINLGNAPAGIYLLQVKKPDSVETRKILLTQ